MKTPQIRSTSLRTHVSHAGVAALLTALVGCAHAPLKYAGGDLNIVPAADIPANVTAPMPVRTVAPVYPHEMRRNGIQGSAEVLCLVDENGTVLSASYLKATNADFAQSAVAAAEKWSFAPGTYDGTRVPLRVLIPFTFDFEPDQPKPAADTRISLR